MPSEDPTDPEFPADPGSPTDSPKAAAQTGFRRWLLLSAGIFLTALGTLGAFLPILPTTPFVILAAACFAKSSPAFHRRLLANRFFGSYLAQWQSDHSVPLAAKRKAYGLVVLTFSVSIYLLDGNLWRWLLAILGLLILGLLASLRTTEQE